ncbi:hypothetical protein Bca52824_026105 [Brassica carinata]|uniref:EF-hand domain-containing protein n=1 Tax=Brassica carinata TaxID=52824 RepID=A0A8X7SHY6_BRACI|nr:hypothetical protein Bca52824_026105 [Brassica carinata]
MWVIGESINTEEIQGLKAIFANIGTITYKELKEGLAKLGSKLTEAEVKHRMDAADVDGNGSIDYIEFITATMHRHRHFDKDSSGYMTIDELEITMNEYGMGDDATIKEVLFDVDSDNN